jgi:tetratricopeptide (TPR) repeat protein
MGQDIRGLTITTASDAAVAAFDHAIEGYLRYRADIPARMAAVFAADPYIAMGHCLKGYFAMLAFKDTALPLAQEALKAAWRFVPGATPREHAHVAALESWANGEPDRAVEVWNQILADHPHDVLAFRLAHFVNFWLGRPEAMLASVLAVEKHWSEAMPGYNAILGCRCFAHEESGYYTEAEHAGREAIRRDPGDLWSAHGVAHVMEMTGRRGEGIAWVDALAPHWEGGNNLQHHLWWHQAMYFVERGDLARVLTLYDTRFRDLNAPLTQGTPDLYIDVQNAASMLFRLGRHGVDVGDRWVELADKAETRIGD